MGLKGGGQLEVTTRLPPGDSLSGAQLQCHLQQNLAAPGWKCPGDSWPGQGDMGR